MRYSSRTSARDSKSLSFSSHLLERARERLSRLGVAEAFPQELLHLRAGHGHDVLRQDRVIGLTGERAEMCGGPLARGLFRAARQNPTRADRVLSVRRAALQGAQP